MFRSSQIKREKYNTYEYITTHQDITDSLELIGLSELIDKTGHLLIEMNDGDIVTVYLSEQPKPSIHSLYERIYEC